MSGKYLGEVSTPILINQIKDKYIPKVTSMPTNPTEGDVVFYIGTAITYTHGGLYEYQEITPSTTPKTYHWVLISSDGEFVGTWDDWNALGQAEQDKYTFLSILDDGETLNLGIYLRKVQTMPLAEDCPSESVLYVGTTTQDYTKGYIYRSVPSVVSGETVYNWELQYLQADWAQSNANAVDYIKNKPTLGTASEKNYTSNVRPNNTDLVESHAVYSAINSALSSIYVPRGELSCAELTTDLLIPANVGNVYTMSDSGTTSALFINGAGHPISTNDNVGIIRAGADSIMFNLMGNAFDLHGYQTKELETPLTIGGVEETTVESALDALNDEAEIKQDIMQFDILPEASEDYFGKIVQYVGNSTDTLIQGRFYECISDGAIVPTYSWKLVTLEKEYSANNVRILINKGKNALLSAPLYGTEYYAIYPNGFVPNTAYKLFVKPTENMRIAGFQPWVTGGTNFNITTDGMWIDFTTNDTIPNYRTTLFHETGHSDSKYYFDCIYAVKASDWSEDMPHDLDNTGYIYTLPFDLKRNEFVTERLVNRDGSWYKESSYHDTLTTEVSKLDDRSNMILTLSANLAHNDTMGFDVQFVDANHDALYDVKELIPEDIDYISISDYRYIHKGKEFNIIGMTEAAWGLMNVNGDATSLENAKIEPFVFFDAANLGCNTLQLSIMNGIFFDDTTFKPQSDYQMVLDVIDYITALGFRIIFKFYSFDWREDTINNNTLALEKMFVDRYKNYKNVIGYSVTNEPNSNHLSQGDTEANLARFTAFLSEIHKYITDNTSQIMFYEKDNEAIDHTVGNTAFETHYYAPQAFSHAGASEPYKCEIYPYAKYVERSGIKIAGPLYTSALRYAASQYARSITLNDTSGTTEWTPICLGKIKNQNEYQKQLLVSGILTINQIQKGVEYLDIKDVSFNFYDANDTLVRTYNYAYDDEWVTSHIDDFFSISSTKSGTTSYLTPSEKLSVVTDNDDKILRFSCDNDDIGAYITMNQTNLGARTEYVNAWTNAFNEGEDYLEIVFTIRLHSDENSKIKCEATGAGTYYKYVIAGTPNYTPLRFKAVSDNAFDYKEPIYIGEIGVNQSKYKSDIWKQESANNKGGVQWAQDVLREMHKLGISYSWFVYASAVFGIANARNTTSIFEGAWGEPVYNKLLEANSNHISYDGYRLDTEVTPNSKIAPTSGAVYNALLPKADKTEVSIQISELPTASADYLGRTYLYIGTTNANYTHGGIYECQENTPSTDPKTYHWVLISTSEPTVITTAQIEAQLALFD